MCKRERECVRDMVRVYESERLIHLPGACLGRYTRQYYYYYS